MKYKNSNNQSHNVINDTDITMTGQYQGETLDTVVEDISELKRNVKFLYLYGGVGSHSGGSGSGSSEDFSIYATLNKVQINLDNLISLDGANKYNLLIMINKPAGLEYAITCTYFTKNSSVEGTTFKTTLNISNLYSFSRYLDLDINGSIRIEAFTVLSSGDAVRKQVSANYITSPYTIDVYLGDREGNKPNMLDNELFISACAEDGLYAYMEYDIGIQSTVSYSYNLIKSSKIETKDLDLSESSRGKVQIPIIPDGFLIDDNAGYYYSIITIYITPVGLTKTTILRNLNFNLIPNDLYLKVSPTIKEASLYEEEDYELVENPYAFKIGNIAFDLKIYNGRGDSGTKGYKVSTTVTNINSGTNNTFSDIYLNERQSYTTKNIESTEHGWNKVTFEVTKNDKYHKTEKYFYVSQVNLDLNWTYFWNKNGNNVRHFGINGTFYTNEFLQLFNNDKILILSESTGDKSLSMDAITASSNFTAGETLINIGILYNSINDQNEPLLAITSSSNNTDDIIIYLNKIEIGTSDIHKGELVGDGINIYIPKEDLLDPYDTSKYHLLTFYRKFYEEVPGKGAGFEVLVYIDGVLEGALPKITFTSKIFDRIKFYGIGYSINLFDILYFPQTNSGKLGFFNDADISRYWYTYNDFKLTGRYSESELLFLKEINDVVSNFKLNSKSAIDSTVNTRMVEVNDISTLENLAKILGIAPMLLLDITDTAEYSQNNSNYTNNFIKWYQERIDVNAEDYTGRKKVTVSYKGTDETVFSPIGQTSTSGGQIIYDNRYSFYIEKQGTSTLANIAKNLNLIIESNNEADTDNYLFSPNFEEVTNLDAPEDLIKKYNTFLPERKFTLKKDVVDSAHTNNNSIADFVNKNTTKFNTNLVGTYTNYIKNCLTGFPCLVFVRTSYRHELTQLELTKIYYLGYYNFNLGRDSYYNLGYKDLNNLSDRYIENVTDNTSKLSNGFKVYKIPRDIDVYDPELVISEVQDLSSYYDFSLYDPSILFGADSLDKNSMFGDFVYSKELENTYRNSIYEFVRHISLSGGYIFEKLKKNFGLLTEEYLKTILLDDETISSYNLVPNYKVLYEKVFNDNITERGYNFVPKSTPGDIGSSKVLMDTLMGDDNDPENIKPPYLDYISAVEYYVILMAFGLTDSIEKNLNIKSWNGGKTFYLAFYDMDTALGVDNAGHDVTYYAFSDYYDIPFESTLLLKAVVYRDFAFQGKGSYDVPSSYLMAIAKYAKLLLGDSLEIGTFPLEYWSLLRKSELRNADTFMNNYYRNRKKSVGETLMNYNYRATYFIESKDENDIMYFPDSFSKFHGSREYKVRDWLNERLHVLDVYMGLVSTGATNRYIEYFDTLDNKWKTLMSDGGEAMKELEITTKPTDNDDVIIFKDIFGDNKQYSKTINTNIRALENSFVVLITPTSTPLYYMIKNPMLTYTLQVPITGTLKTTFGGSDRWTYIENLAPFIVSNSLYVNSNNLQEFNIIGTESLVLVSGRCPAVRKVYIQGSNNKFSLEVNNFFPNVLSINLVKCGVSLSIEDSTITKLSLLGVDSLSLIIMDCKYLSDFEIGNYSETINGVLTITNTKLGSLSINPLDDDFISRNVSIRSINITAIGENRSLEIIGNSTLEELNITGFTNIVISNCPYLYKINITQGELPINNFKVTNCGNSLSNILLINYNDENEYYADLSSLTINGEVSFKECSKLTNINLPPCKLSAEAFYNTGLKKIKCSSENPEILITGVRTFNQCPISEGLLYVSITKDCSDISGTFSNTLNGSLTITEIEHFLKNIPENNSVTNINSLFAYQRNFSYNYNDNFSENESTCKLSLRKFKKVVTATNIFHNTSLSYFNKFIFYGLGDNNTNPNHSVNLGGAMNVSSGTLYCTIDSLKYIIGKTNTLNIFISVSGSSNTSYLGVSDRKLKLVKAKNTLYSDSESKHINILDFFRYDSNSTVTFEDVYNVQFDQYHNYYLFFAKPTEIPGEYEENWPNLKLIYNCFDKVYSELEGEALGFDTLNLNKVSNLRFIYNSFNNILSSRYLDLYNLINWTNFGTTQSISFSNINSFGNVRPNNINNKLLYNSFRLVRKYINLENYNELLSRIKQSGYYTKFGNIFENCIMITNSSDGFVPNIGNENTTCINMVDTFASSKIVKTSAIQDIINDDWYNNLEDSDFIPLDISLIISRFPKCIVFDGTFLKITINKALPINFFKRRTLKISEIYRIDLETNELLIEEEHYVKGKLIEYVYSLDSKLEITNLNKCFFLTKILGSHFYFNKNDFDDFNSLLSNYITDLSGNILSDTKYKTSVLSGALVLNLPINYEIEDCNNIVRYDHSGIGLNIAQDVPYTNIGLSGFENDNEDYENILFVAPDILYSCSKDCNITLCFAESNFVGALPRHLFLKLTSPIIENWINKTNILPQYISESTMDTYLRTLTDSRVKRNYVFVPDGFGKINNYNYGFTFNLRLPKQFNLNNEEEKVIAYYMFTKNSFLNKQATIANSLPVYIEPYASGTYISTSGSLITVYKYSFINNGSIYFNIMYNESGNDGWNLTNLSNFMISNLFTVPYVKIGFGYLFSDPTKTWTSCKRNGTTPIMSYDSSGTNSGVYIIFPTGVNNIGLFITNSASGIGSGGQTTKIRRSLILGNPDNYSEIKILVLNS